MSAEKIRKKLKTVYDVDMERRAIYRNIDALQSMGIEIEGYRDNREGYYLVDRMFEPSEIRLLCDAVAASNMIREESSKSIMNKLADTQSIFQKRMLQKTVFVKNRTNIQNKKLFYNIDILNIAINQGNKVAAGMLEYNREARLEKKKGDGISFSPYATVWADGNYYVIAKIENEEQLTHFRIDYLTDISMLERGIDIVFGGISPQQYAEKYIYNNGERMEYFEIECSVSLWNELVETFGGENHVSLTKKDKNVLTVRVKSIPTLVKKWIMSHSSECIIKSPRQYKEEIQVLIRESYRKYWS
ncbi:MAG: WYL domain-containing protein [Lachnospiraceae bacterium]|nr:WYL domain-containing protein [Lachnospiraceae bacterium]